MAKVQKQKWKLYPKHIVKLVNLKISLKNVFFFFFWKDMWGYTNQEDSNNYGSCYCCKIPLCNVGKCNNKD